MLSRVIYQNSVLTNVVNAKGWTTMAEGATPYVLPSLLPCLSLTTSLYLASLILHPYPFFFNDEDSKGDRGGGGWAVRMKEGMKRIVANANNIGSTWNTQIPVMDLVPVLDNSLLKLLLRLVRVLFGVGILVGMILVIR